MKVIPDPKRAGETLVKYTLYLNVIGVIAGIFLNARTTIFLSVIIMSIIMLGIRKGILHSAESIVVRSKF